MSERSSPQPSLTLACERCSKLKVKCGKEYPACTQCQKTGHQCTPVLRTRRPRGRNGGRPGNNAELNVRLGRLENLVLSMQGKHPTPNSAESEDSDFGGSAIQRRTKTGPLNDPNGVTVSTTPSTLRLGANIEETMELRSSAPLGQSLFEQLSGAVEGIREILDDTATDVNIGPIQNGTGLEKMNGSHTTSRHLFSSPNSPPQHAAVPMPHQITFLLKIFRQRVHPVVKVVHMPILEKEISLTLLDQGCWTADLQKAAAHAAILYASVCSLTDAECWESLGQGRSELQISWRKFVEHQIASSNFLVSERVETLQALVLYLVAVRSHDSSRTVWTLLPLAIRIAQALQLHREESYKSLSRLEAHIRRSIWHCLLITDFQAAMDRGSDTIISERGSSTRPPIHIEDSRLDDSCQSPLSPDLYVTEMTLFSMECECAAIVRSLNFVEPADMERAPSVLQYDWNARNEVVSSLERKFQWYLSFSGYGGECTAYHNLAKTILSAMRLYVVRPLQSHPAMKAPNIMELNVLQVAEKTVSASLALNNESHIWNWYSRQFNAWHPLAVLLAELAVMKGGVAPDSWALARQAYIELGRNITEGVNGPLWRPISKLMRAAEDRQKDSAQCVGSSAVNSNVQPDLSDLGIVPDGGGFDQSWAYWEAFINELGSSENQSIIDLEGGLGAW